MIKTLAIMQPYFLPYSGHFSLIDCSDKWIVNDEVQMIQKGWIQRNRILNQQGGWNYIRVPLLKHPHKTKIKNVLINNSIDWQGKILEQTKHYKRKSPHYWEVRKLLETIFSTKFDTITGFNVHALKLICHYLDIDFNYSILSEINLDLSNISAPDEWSLYTCKGLGYKKYLNSIGGKKFYDVEKFENHGIKVSFMNKKSEYYDQGGEQHINSLSILDVLMFNSPHEALELIRRYNLI